MTTPKGTALEDLPLDVLREIDRRCDKPDRAGEWRQRLAGAKAHPKR